MGKQILPGLARGGPSRSDGGGAAREDAPGRSRHGITLAKVASAPPPFVEEANGPPPPDKLGEEFCASAVRLAGLAGVAFGWAPEAFWNATPAELSALVRAVVPEEALPPDAAAIARLKELFPDG